MRVFVLLVAMFLGGGPTSAGQPLVVDNAQLRLEIEPEHGVIARICDKQGRIELAAAGGLADNFRLVLRTADKKSRTILGRNQALSKSTAVDGGLDLTWAGPLTDTEGGTHRLPVRMEIRLSKTTLQFRLLLDNQTPHRVAEAWYPVVGGLAGFADGSGPGETFVMMPAAAPSVRKVAWPFGEMVLAYPAPGQLNMSFSSVYNTQANRALYFASHDPVARLKYYRFFEQSAPVGKDVFACIQHVPFTSPGQRFEGSPVVLRFHDGTWEAAGPLYREWFTRTFGVMDPSRNWIRRQSFIQDTMFLLPEGTLNYTFQDLPGWAKAARDHGVTGVLVSGWHRGGHDNGYSHYEPDPRLGTYDDLKRALEACHQLGVRVYFFVNYQPAMIESEWYKRELHRFVEMREDGDYGTCGWGMGTLWARLGHSKPMIWIDPSFPEYREALLRQFLKLVEVGADGLHVDKMFPNAMNFNPRCELGPDTSHYEGPIRLSRTLLAEARKRNPDFALSFECNWDRMLEFGNAIWWVGNMSLARKVFPEMVETRAITSPYDYLGVNNAVRSSQVGLLGPLNYSRSIGWEPWQGLAQYLGEVKRIQDGLSEAVFFGENVGRGQIELGHEPAAGIEYNVFRSLKAGQRVCLLTNSGREPQRQSIQGFAPRAGGTVRIHAPFTPSRDAPLPVEVLVPAERIVFVEELPASDRPVAPAPPQQTTAVPPTAPSPASATTNPIVNGNFESGDFTGWIADPNWRVDRNTCGEYRGWEGKAFAWSGGQGEAATGRLRSQPFVLDQDGVRLLIAGWNTAPGANRTWNCVTLNAADGTELDRRSAPNSLSFVPVLLDGSDHKGERVYLEAVDDADQKGFSMFCIDDVRTVQFPPGHRQPLEPLPPFDERAALRLENERYRVEVSRANGAITRILDKTGNLEFIREPRLAGNFEFTLPLPGREPWETIEANYLVGRDQALTAHDLQGSTLTLRWQRLKNRSSDLYDVAATMGITLEKEAIRFTLRIENQTRYPLGEIFFPVLGGVTGLGHRYRELKSTELVRPVGTGITTADIFFLFPNLSGLGDQGPEQFFVYPKDVPEPWLEFFNPRLRRSIYLGAHDRDDRSLVLHLELLPGNAETPRWDGNWPRREELQGQPAGVLLSFVHFAQHPAGKTYEAAPVVLQAHDGDWHAGQPIYRRWKDERF